MYFQPAHLPFGPQKGAFYRGQFVIWPRVLKIMLFSNDSGSLIATSESVVKPLQFLSGKCMGDHCLRNCYLLIIIMSLV